MRLPDAVYARVRSAGVDVFFADRWMTRFWNDRRSAGDLRFYGGWYWWKRGEDGRADTPENGPFHTRASAFRDAYEKCQLRWGM